MQTENLKVKIKKFKIRSEKEVFKKVEKKK